MSGLDIEGVLAAHDGLGYDDCDGCACGADVRSWEAHRAHVAAVLREQIADWLLGDEAYREVAFRSILNEGAAWTALRTLAALVAPSRVPGEENVSGVERLPNGLTAAQDAALDDLARAIASHINGDPECDCDLHPRVPSTSEGEGT